MRNSALPVKALAVNARLELQTPKSYPRRPDSFKP